MAIGTIIAPLALILCSYATQLWHIYLAQGLLFGIGCGLLFSSSVALPAQFFSRNRAFAVGIAVSASGIGGVSLSPMTTHLIETLGYRQALRVLGAFGFGLLIIATALAFSKHRPTIKGSYFSSIIDTSIVNREFVILLVYGFLATFGYLAPYFLAPQYATYLGYDIETGANMVSVMSGMNAVSRIICGFFADRLGKLNMLAGTSLAAGIFAMVMWQFSTSYNVYVGFCVLYGLTSSVFVSLLPAILADIVGVRKIQQGIGMAYSIAFFGSLVGPAIAGILLQQFGWTAAIQFSGAPTVAGGLVVLYLRHLRSNGKFFCII
ncbi:major facilitator superfamily domain-containing protein [Gongronella butleri]|nr:major facilitator superfamily domain-containing protein [Gongronella butleri]